MNGNMDSAKYQGDVIYDIKMVGECVMFSQKGYMVSRHATRLKELEHS